MDRHLAGCVDCARVRREFLRLETLLPSAYPEPRLSADFDANLLQRLRTVDRKRVAAGECGWSAASWRASTVAALTATALSAAALVLFWRSANSPGHGEPRVGPGIRKPELAESAVQRSATGGRSPGVRSPHGLVPGGQRPHASLAMQTFHFSLRHFLTGARGCFGFERRYRGQPSAIGAAMAAASHGALGAAAGAAGAEQVSAAPADLNVSVTWSDAAATYTSLGDFSRASQAYANAYHATQNVDYAIDASVTAERSGDESAALGLCAEALQQATFQDSSIPMNGDKEDEHKP